MRRWHQWSLRGRIVVVSAALLTVAITLGVVAFGIALDRILYSSALDAARAQATQVAASVSGGDTEAAEAVRDLPSQGSLLQLLDPAGSVVAASDRAAETRPLTTLRPAPGVTVTQQTAAVPGERGEPYALAVSGFRDRTGKQYVLVVASPLDVEANTVRASIALLAVGSALLLVLLLVLISRTVTRSLQPVERIRTEVARINRAGASDRITVPPTRDEIARLAETMNQMLARMERADTSTRQFVSDASHELRSPLATIRAALEVSATEDDQQHSDRDGMLMVEALRMQRLVDDLLTLAKADDQGLRLAAEEVDLDDLVDAEVRRVRATARVPVQSSIEAARVIGDTARLSQVLRNLVDNAVRHTAGWIVLSVATQQGQVVLRVDNEGPAVAEPLRQQIFDRFVRLEQARARDSGGSGLGLAIAKTVVQAHGGSIVATQTETGQCRFEVRLPAAPV